jgi:2-octaprenyl-6-methoxyphenol hydroxylase
MTAMGETKSFDAAVVGTGPAGLAAALALRRTGLTVALIGPPPNGSDARTAALFPSSVKLLERLGVWPQLAPLAAPLQAIRIIDRTGHLIKAPETLFRACEIGLAAFAWNIANAPLALALHARATAPDSGIAAFGAKLERLAIGESRVKLELEGGGEVEARLVAGADGQASPCRAAAGIASRRWSYDQSAIALSFDHGRPHGDTSSELHRDAGPFTTVPLPGNRSSLVWTERPQDAGRLAKLGDAELIGEIERRLEGLLGPVSSLSARGVFAMRGLIADRLAASRIALVGEAAHAFPPIGAQGLNLGLRDAAALADAAGQWGRDPGSADALAAYEAARRSDVRLRTSAIDALNRSLIEGYLPFQLARGAGLHLMNALPPVRRTIMRRGLLPPGELPSLMR